MVVTENSPDRVMYHVVLTKRGCCSVYTAADALSQLMGYSSSQALALVKQTPVSIGEHLSLVQARYLSRALVEYGMCAEIHDQNDAYIFEEPTHETVFDLQGRIIRNVSVILHSICSMNRVTTCM